MNHFKKIILKICVILPIATISFAAQSALLYETNNNKNVNSEPSQIIEINGQEFQTKVFTVINENGEERTIKVLEPVEDGLTLGDWPSFEGIIK